MSGRIDELEKEEAEIVARLSEAAASGNAGELRSLSRRHRELQQLVSAYREREGAEEDLAAAREMLDEAPGDQRDLARAEVAAAEERLRRAENALAELLIPRDPNEAKDVIVEIRGAEGGEEANLFAKDLFDMYWRWAERRGWKAELFGAERSERGGLNEVTFALRGEGVWARMKHEAGPHRVQRVPVTESQGRIHTSSATVTVLPEAAEVEVNIDPADLKVEVYRSTGPGGQSVNTTDSAVRITHKPTGIVVAMQDEKSQLQNRAKAMQVLRARLLRAEQDRIAGEASSQRRSQVGGGGRSEKIRTYNFKENRVTDHRTGLTLYRLDRVLLGELDELSDALVQLEREQAAGR